MTYGLVIWGSSAHTKKIFTLQKRAIRVLESVSATTHARPLFKKNSILTVYSAYIYLSVMEVRDGTHMQQKDVHTYNTRGRELLVVPHSRLHTTDGIHNGIRMHNMLPASIKEKTGRRFQTELKKYLTEKAYYSIDEFWNQD